uniref:Uncharacterized protein n=1 Tax=Mustela putorius furo TaxID=9669 RepID=M3YE94_MUSPF
MKILVFTATILSFVACFPYNGNQETHNQTNYLSANPPLSASESHTASQLSSTLRTKNNSAPTDDSNSYSESADTVTRHSGSLSKRNHSETLRASIYNFTPFGNDLPRNPSAAQTSANFAYVEGIAESPMSNVSPSSAAMQDTSAVSTTISRFVPDSAVTQSRMAVSGENSTSVPASVTTHQYKSDSIAIPHYQRDSKATQSLERFFPSTGRSKRFFASNPAAYRRNTKNEFSASADESNTAVSNTNNLLGTYSSTREEEAQTPSIFFAKNTNDFESFPILKKQRLGSLIDKERTNEEESTPYMEVKPAVGEDGIFQIKEDLLPAQLSSGFERNGFAAVDSTKSPSKLSSSIPTTEVTVSDSDLTIAGEENVDVLYDVSKPSNGKIHFKTIVTKATVNDLGKSAAVKQNVEAADGTEFLPTGNSVLRSRKDHPILSNLYYHVITDDPLTTTKENPNVAQNTMQRTLFAMDNADLTDYGNDSQTLAAITSSNAKRLI